MVQNHTSKLFALVFWQMCFLHRTQEEGEKGQGNLGAVRTRPFKAHREVWWMGNHHRSFREGGLKRRQRRCWQQCWQPASPVLLLSASGSLHILSLPLTSGYLTDSLSFFRSNLRGLTPLQNLPWPLVSFTQHPFLFLHSSHRSLSSHICA